MGLTIVVFTILVGIPCPDKSLTCSRDALCGYDQKLTRFYCSCKEGFTGDGHNCKGNKRFAIKIVTELLTNWQSKREDQL